MSNEAIKVVLLIEASATLRYALEKHLRTSGYQTRVATCYADGLQQLQTENQRQANIDLVVVGWPAHTYPEADEVFTHLEQPEYAKLPVLVLVQDPEPATRTWAIRRAHTAMLDWRHHHEISATVRKLQTSLHNSRDHTQAQIPRRDQIRILFVDDSPSVRAYYRRLLTSKGYTIDVASSVNEGFEKAKTNNYDIAIIDYFMPQANGDELCKRLHNDPKTAGILSAIFTSTYLDQVIRDSLNAGAVECMFKNEVDDLFLARVDAMSRSVHSTRSISAQGQRLQSILNSVGDGVYGVDCDGRITFANPTARILLGYDEENDLIGQFAHQLFHSADVDGSPIEPASSVLYTAYASKQTIRAWETVFWTREGKCIPVECTLYPLYVRLKHEGAVIAFRDISERKTLEERLRWQATHDPLTELFNRRYFEEQLEREHLWQIRNKGSSALLYLDLDHFKYVNDTLGHTSGDALLVQIGQRLLQRLRKTDILARLGGDEFAIIMRNVNPYEIVLAADAFRTAITDLDFPLCNKDFKVSASIGIALFDHRAQSPGDILVDADIACYIAKSNGGNQTHLYSPESDHKTKMNVDLGWSSKLREALDKGHFELRYQPILPLDPFRGQIDKLRPGRRIWDDIDLDTIPGHIGFEVLIRMRDSNGQIIPPDTFIPTAERFYLMPDIDFWVIDCATAKLAQLQRRIDRICFSINLSGHTLCHRSLIAHIQAAIARHALDPAALTFEVTETVAIYDMQTARKAIHALKELGCNFSLDDFGTGFSSFSHLKQLPVDFVKIDGMFVQAITHDSIDRTMVASMTDIAHCLGCRTIAEYVDSPEIMQALLECGVDYIQGNIIAEPLDNPLPVKAIKTRAS